MKKLVNILFATAVAAFALVSCQKNMQEENVSQKETAEAPAIHFYATDIATKTVFGDFETDHYPTLWTINKGIKISYNKKTSVEATVTPKDGDAKADFTPASEITDAGTGTNVFYALSPSTAQAANISGSYYSWRFTVPTSQTPLDASVDEDAQVLYAKYDAGATFPTAVPFSFRHLTAYGKLSFKGLALDGDETVTSITLTASEDWVGEWYYYVDTKDPNTEGDIKPASASKKLTLNTDKVTDIWFACAPVDLSDGGTIDINVFTNKGVFVKKITFPAGKGDFAYGEIGAFMVDMSGVTRASMVNSIAEIKALYSSSAVPFVANLTDALVTIVSGDNFYMQDATGGILGFTAGHGLSVGDMLNGVISGSVTEYYKTKEITGFDNSATKTTDNPVTPAIVEHATLVDHFADYESEYIKVEGLTVTEVSGKDITVSENANLKIRNESGKTITVGTQLNAVGAAVLYNSIKQVKIYSLADDDIIKIGTVITASDKAVEVGSTVSIGATTNSPATITYVSDDESIATVDEDGVITGKAVGDATITCSVAASGKYTAQSKVITVKVTASGVTPDPVETDVFANIATVTGSGKTQTATWTNGDITISAVKGNSSTAFRTTDTDHTRFYKDWTITVTSASNTISSVEFTCTGTSYATALVGYTFTSGTASASGSKVTVTGVNTSSTSVTLGAQVRVSSIKVVYQ